MADIEPAQGTFDFESGNMDGFANWRRQQEARLEAIRWEWSLPISRPVTVRLKDIDDDFVGTLTLVEQPLTIDRRLPLRLRIGRVEFFSPDIEQCVLMD